MKEKDFIPGIYNHCDRWCERCEYTHYCKLYYDEKRQFNALENKDDYMVIVSQNLKKTMQMLQKIAEDRGVDLNDLNNDDAFEKEQQKTNSARNHPLAQHAFDYADKIEAWFKTNDFLIEEKKKYLKNIDLGIDKDENNNTLRRLDEAVNIIKWYQFQIHIKLASAIRYYPHDPLFEDEIQNMHHNSAKIALIGIENSMKALQSLLELLTSEEDFILDTLLKLQKLQTQIHKQFPLLSKFKRPVFDD